MHVLVGVDSPPRSDQRLPGDLAAERAEPLLLRVVPAEEVDLDGFEVEEADQLIEGGGHG